MNMRKILITLFTLLVVVGAGTGAANACLTSSATGS